MTLFKHPYLFMGIICLAFISSAMETDIYVPSFPDMMDAFGITQNEIQKILSYNFMGLALSSLMCGPLSDSFGRKPVLMWGTGLFALSSLACYFSMDFSTLIALRVLQGIGAGSILTVAITTLFDVYDAKKSAQLVSILNTVIQGAMALAPLLGSFLNIHLGWRSIFLCIVILSSLTWFNLTFILQETLAPNRRVPFSIVTTIRQYIHLLRDGRFMGLTLIRSLLFASLMVYTSSISVLMMDHLHVPEHYFGFYQSTTLGAYCVSAFIASVWIPRLGLERIKRMGIRIYFIGIFALFGITVLAPLSAIGICLTMAIIGAGIGLVIGIYFALALEGQKYKGACVALTQTLSMVYMALSIEIARMIFDGSIMSITLILGLMAGITGLAVWLTPYRTFHS